MIGNETKSPNTSCFFSLLLQLRIEFISILLLDLFFYLIPFFIFMRYSFSCCSDGILCLLFCILLYFSTHTRTPRSVVFISVAYL